MSGDRNIWDDLLSNSAENYRIENTEKDINLFKKKLFRFNFFRFSFYTFNIFYLSVIFAVTVFGATLSVKYLFHEKQKPVKHNINSVIHTDSISGKDTIIKKNTGTFQRKISVPPKRKEKNSLILNDSLTNETSTKKPEKEYADTLKVTVKDTVRKKVKIVVRDTVKIKKKRVKKEN